MDELLAAMYKVSVQLVPILGVAVLCFLIYLLRHCVTFIKELTVMVQKAGSAMEGVDKSIDKLQAPLDTVVRYLQRLTGSGKCCGSCQKYGWFYGRESRQRQGGGRRALSEEETGAAAGTRGSSPDGKRRT